MKCAIGLSVSKYSLELLIRFWKIHPGVAESFEISPETLYFEVEYDTVLRLASDSPRVFTPISRFQKIERELNFVLDEQIKTGDIATTISSLHPWIHDVYVDSVYRDEEKIGKEKKSVNFAFTLINNEDTLSDAAALEVQNNIIAHMEKLWYTLRS